MHRLVGAVGIAVMVLLTVLLSHDRRNINWRRVAAGLALQAGLGVLLLRTGFGRGAFTSLAGLFSALLRFQEEGARFVFGNLVQPLVPVGTPGPGGALDTSAGYVARVGALFAFNVIPTIIFISALMSVLYYLGVMQRLVKAIAWVMQRTFRTSGAETVAAAGNIFLGNAQVPLIIRPYLARLTRSELVTVMVVGFATAASAVMAVYVGMLQRTIPGIAGDLMAASCMNAVAAVLLAKILMPETETPATTGSLDVDVEVTDTGILDAAANGALQGIKLGMGIAAMVIAFIALLALVDAGLGWVGALAGHPDASLKLLVGELLRPFMWIIGVPWPDTGYVGGLVAIKVTLNDIVAYSQFAGDLGAGVALDPRARIICTYVLLGFANFSAMGIQIGAIGGLAPERRGEVARYGLRAMVVANLAGFMTAAFAGLLL